LLAGEREKKNDDDEGRVGGGGDIYFCFRIVELNWKIIWIFLKREPDIASLKS
jgi:hypothetical protein